MAEATAYDERECCEKNLDRSKLPFLSRCPSQQWPPSYVVVSIKAATSGLDYAAICYIRATNFLNTRVPLCISKHLVLVEPHGVDAGNKYGRILNIAGRYTSCLSQEKTRVCYWENTWENITM